MDPLSVSTVLNGIASGMWSMLGPMPSAVSSLVRAMALVPDPTVRRFTEAQLNYLSTDRRGQNPLGIPEWAGPRYSNTFADPSALISLYHQWPVGDDGWPTVASKNWLKSRLRRHGIDAAFPDENDRPAIARDWYEIVMMAATAAPLDAFVYDYWRSIGTPQEQIATDRLNFALRRGGYSRKADRQHIAEGWWRWTVDDIYRLFWIGKIDNDTFVRLLSAAGYHNEEDGSYAQFLAAYMPDASTLLRWQQRRLWDDGIAGRFALDEQPDGQAVGRYFARAQGVRAAGIEYPDAPDGSQEWDTLTYRASRPLPGFGECIEMEHRLRPDHANADVAVDGVSRPWVRDDTIACLRAAGYSEPVIKSMLGLVVSPINVRIVNELLTEILKHDDIRDIAVKSLGDELPWVTSAYLDHGLRPEIADLAARAIIARADDQANAERDEEIKRQRASRRAIVVEAYSQGRIAGDDARMQLIGPFFTAAMATEELLQEDFRIRNQIATKQITMLREAWMRGAFTWPQVVAQLRSLNVSDVRIALYATEWQWERTESVRILNTGEILTLLKDGLLTPDVARLRLDNLGWSDADAILQIALVQHNTALAAGKAQAAIDAKEAREAQAQAKAQAAQEAKDLREAQLQARQAAKENLDAQLASHEDLLASDKYYAVIHAANDAYEAAKKKGDTEKMNAEIAKQYAAYQAYIDSLIRIHSQPGVTSSVPQTTPPDTPVAP